MLILKETKEIHSIPNKKTLSYLESLIYESNME